MPNFKFRFSNFLAPLALALFFSMVGLGAANAASITDRSGRFIQFEQPFKRIISLYPAHTENLFSLGLDKEIIGVSKSDDFPEQVIDKNKFHYREDPEKFIAARPDLVLVRPMIYRAYPNLIEKLHLAGIEVVSLQPASIDETFDYWRQLGLLTGRIAEAETMISSFKAELAKLQVIVTKIPATARKKVYFEAIHSKMKTFTPGSMAIFALSEAGGVNIADDAKSVRNTNIAYYGKEHILAKGEQIDLFLAQRGKMNRISEDIIFKEPGFAAIKAVRNRQVFVVDEKLVSRPTMRLIQGIKIIGALLYPQRFTPTID